MKSFRKILWVLVVVPFLMSCETEEPNGNIMITFDSSSNAAVSPEGNFEIKGVVKTDKGTTVDEISIMCLYVGNAKNESTGLTEKKKIAELAANTDSEEVKKVSNNEYTFCITQENRVFSTKITLLYGMRINVRMKNGQRASKDFSIRPAYKI